MPAGRPSTFTQETAELICNRLAAGESLRKICESENIPSFVTVFKWLHDYPDFLKRYARAREVQAENMAETIVEIADNLEEDPNSRRVRVDSRKWLLSKLLPKKYGDAQLIKHADADGNALKIEVTRIADTPRQLSASKVIDIQKEETDGSEGL